MRNTTQRQAPTPPCPHSATMARHRSAPCCLPTALHACFATCLLATQLGDHLSRAGLPARLNPSSRAWRWSLVGSRCSLFMTPCPDGSRCCFGAAMRRWLRSGMGARSRSAWSAGQEVRVSRLDSCNLGQARGKLALDLLNAKLREVAHSLLGACSPPPHVLRGLSAEATANMQLVLHVRGCDALDAVISPARCGAAVSGLGNSVQSGHRGARTVGGKKTPTGRPELAMRAGGQRRRSHAEGIRRESGHRESRHCGEIHHLVRNSPIGPQEPERSVKLLLCIAGVALRGFDMVFATACTTRARRLVDELAVLRFARPKLALGEAKH
mmetsp:Transcript_19724/g.75756  ORF Transcript_19724/g.75756 Transcript_19724/m.75756 type:complete len:326 (+) Transcript_19724:196-1173(+)